MYILSLECDNMYMFKNFRIDFTYSRKGKHFLAADDLVFPDTAIYVRKKIVIMGGNAAGKTTFGKLIWDIYNVILARAGAEDTKKHLENARYDKKRPAKFIVEMAFGEEVHSISVAYDKDGFVETTIRCAQVQPRDNIRGVRERLKEEKAVKATCTKLQNDFISHFTSDEKLAKYREYYSDKLKRCFDFIISGVVSFNRPVLTEGFVDRIRNFLPVIDNSIDRIVDYEAKDNKTHIKLYTIVFKNGEELAMVDAQQILGTDRLSHGTNESIGLMAFLENLRNSSGGVKYLDEKMAHMHAELEKYLAFKMFTIARKDQLFITTHNTELLTLNLPSNAFMIFRRNEEGFNEAFFTNEKMNKNDRDLKNYYDNDYFGALPNYSELDSFFEEYIHEQEEGVYS